MIHYLMVTTTNMLIIFVRSRTHADSPDHSQHPGLSEDAPLKEFKREDSMPGSRPLKSCIRLPVTAKFTFNFGAAGFGSTLQPVATPTPTKVTARTRAVRQVRFASEIQEFIRPPSAGPSASALDALSQHESSA